MNIADINLRLVMERPEQDEMDPNIQSTKIKRKLKTWICTEGFFFRNKVIFHELLSLVKHLKGEFPGFNSPLTFSKVPQVWRRGYCILEKVRHEPKCPAIILLQLCKQDKRKECNFRERKYYLLHHQSRMGCKSSLILSSRLRDANCRHKKFFFLNMTDFFQTFLKESFEYISKQLNHSTAIYLTVVSHFKVSQNIFGLNFTQKFLFFF